MASKKRAHSEISASAAEEASAAAPGSEEGSESDSDEDGPMVGEASGDGARQVIIVLDLASLETIKTKRGEFELLNCDDHRNIAKKAGKNPADYRPDILHQELLAILDSPLNKAGHVKVCGASDHHVHASSIYRHTSHHRRSSSTRGRTC